MYCICIEAAYVTPIRMCLNVHYYTVIVAVVAEKKKK